MSPPPGPRRLAIWELGLLVAGIGVGFWLFGMQGGGPGESRLHFIAVGVLGGASVIGPPILLWERRRRRARWGPGELLWFAHGTSAWLLWPPIIAQRAWPNPNAAMGEGSVAPLCFLYGTPLMAIYMGAALLFGGWIRTRGRSRRRRRSWRERFGLILGALWAATGLWVLDLIYLTKRW